MAFSANILSTAFCFSLIFLFLHQCQSELIYVKGLFTPFYTINKNFKTAFQKKNHFFSLSFLKKIRVNMLNLPHEMINGPKMTSSYFISYYFLFFAGNVYNCNAYTKRLFETFFLQRTVKLF